MSYPANHATPELVPAKLQARCGVVDDDATVHKIC